MRSIQTDAVLAELLDRVLFHAQQLGRVLPEMRFFILESLEFTSLLEKNVYPSSPLNMWEGKRMVHKKRRIETGLESSLYYEVVQTGDPSYVYLNSGNNPVTQASVMAHVVGHCEFSEKNVLRDSNPDRTEYVLYLSRKVEAARQRMGSQDYLTFWNACESAATLISLHSQHNLENSVQTESAIGLGYVEEEGDEESPQVAFQPVFETLNALLERSPDSGALAREVRTKRRRETLSRKGYVLRSPCHDVFGFLRHYAPASSAERAILDYIYVSRAPQDFVIRTQIMNEGWAMYWEKKIMHELFKERAVAGIVDYARVFSAVLRPRPYFQRNPYHLGYHLWCHIEELYRDGKVSLDYTEEIDREKKNTWKIETDIDPIKAMGHLVETITDYEFLRRFLTPDLVHEFHLNRVDRGTARYMRIKEKDIVDADEQWIWLEPKQVKREMLTFFRDFHRPRIYVIDTDFHDGGLLLYHCHDGRALKESWIEPTLKNLNLIWKGPTFLLSGNSLHGYRGGRYGKEKAESAPFDDIAERIRTGERPLQDV